MALGLDVFQAHFRAYQERYVLIGGAACHLWFDDAGEQFRATQDLDIVLIVEPIEAAFVEAFWQFVNEGGYKIRERTGGTPELFRFTNPSDQRYPKIIELFSKREQSIPTPDAMSVARLKVQGDDISLSAILLDDAYYGFLVNYRKTLDGVSLLGPEALIPFKARAFLDLASRKNNGEQIDKRKIKKHKNDIARLAGLLVPDEHFALPHPLDADVSTFLRKLKADGSFDPRTFGVQMTREALIGLLVAYYRLEDNGRL